MNFKGILTAVIFMLVVICGYGQTNMEIRKSGNFAKNIVAFAPFQMTESGVGGFSLSYERAIDNNDIIAFYIPAIAEFNLNSYLSAYGGTTKNYNDVMYYLMPGLKLYPTGGFGPEKYAIGPSLVIANGQKTNNDINYYGYVFAQSHFILGMDGEPIPQH